MQPFKLNARVYLAGPIASNPDGYKDAFDEAEKLWRLRGWRVFNPARTGHDPSVPLAYYMRKDIPELLASDAIAMLPNWQDGQGAPFELHMAQVLDYPIYDAETMEPLEETVLQEASRLVYGTKQDDYGHPLDNHCRTARYWTVLFDRIVTAEEVCLANIVQKISRGQTVDLSRDTLVDIAGYAGNIEMIQDERAVRATDKEEQEGLLSQFRALLEKTYQRLHTEDDYSQHEVPDWPAAVVE